MTESAHFVNLASEPFRRERAQNAVYLAGCAVLVLTVLLLTGLILHDRKQAAYLRDEIAGERGKLQAAQREQASYATVLGRPENADVFATSVFLNQLIARRSVSWTKVFEDLQTVMPNDMRLIGIRLPQVSAAQFNGVNHVQLDMIVGSEHADVVIQLLKRLEGSALFGAASVANQQPPTQNDPLYKYRVTVAYAQKF